MVSSLLQVDLDLPNLTNHSLGLSGIEKSAIPWNSSFPPFCQPVLDDLELVRSQLKRWMFSCFDIVPAYYMVQPPPQALRFSHGRGERETSDWWWTARDHGKGTDGRRTPARSCVVFLAKKSFSWHGLIFGLFKSWKRSVLVAYCCKHCKLWVDRWMAQNFKTWGRNNRQAAKESDSAGFLRIEDL